MTSSQYDNYQSRKVLLISKNPVVLTLVLLVISYLILSTIPNERRIEKEEEGRPQFIQKRKKILSISKRRHKIKSNDILSNVINAEEMTR